MEQVLSPQCLVAVDEQQSFRRGLEQGRAQGLQRALLDLLGLRLGAGCPALQACVRQLSFSGLRRLHRSILSAARAASAPTPLMASTGPRSPESGRASRVARDGMLARITF